MSFLLDSFQITDAAETLEQFAALAEFSEAAFNERNQMRVTEMQCYGAALAMKVKQQPAAFQTKVTLGLCSKEDALRNEEKIFRSDYLSDMQKVIKGKLKPLLTRQVG